MTGYKRDKAIVIGASMAGLMTSNVLAEFFNKVIILERDALPVLGVNRKGVPQGKHTHILLELGRQVMENYFPGLTKELIEIGAAFIPDASENVKWFQGEDFHKPGKSNLSGIAVSRPTLEGLIRKRVLAISNVKLIDETDVVGLETNKTNVAGVRLINRRNNNEEEILKADLVVDASGRGSRSPVWLEKLGYDRPREEEVQIGVGYTTCFYPRDTNISADIKGIVFLSAPPEKRIGVMLAQEGSRWVVTLGGYLGDHVKTDYQSFLEAAKNLPAPDIYDTIKDKEPLGKPVAYKFPANLRHYYENLSRFPQGFLVLGDAICSFNPIYGQGMTVSALEAKELERCLREEKHELANKFFARVSKIVNLSWSTAIGNDLNYDDVEGKRTPMTRFLNWYFEKLHNAAHKDADVSIAFLKVINMVAPPQSILHPRIVLRILMGNLINKSTKTLIENEMKG
jgi:2-polyprenyl-6-methoxyphenol hydroxylase-like FAD-dependent oxidoreductase